MSIDSGLAIVTGGLDTDTGTIDSGTAIVMGGLDTDVSTGPVPVPFITTGVETVSYAALEAQLLADPNLIAYINTWRGDTKPSIFRNADYPLIQFFPVKVLGEEFIGAPLYKICQWEQSIHGRVWADDQAALDEAQVYLGELIADAIESNLTLSGAATRAEITNTQYKTLSDRIAAVIITVKVTTLPFYAPLRVSEPFTRHS